MTAELLLAVRSHAAHRLAPDRLPLASGSAPAKPASRTCGDALEFAVRSEIAPSRHWKQRIFGTRAGLAALLVAMFGLNFVETTVETALRRGGHAGRAFEREVALAMQAAEGGISFERHELTPESAVHAASIAYFFVFPGLLGGVLIAVGAPRS